MSREFSSIEEMDESLDAEFLKPEEEDDDSEEEVQKTPEGESDAEETSTGDDHADEETQEDSLEEGEQQQEEQVTTKPEGSDDKQHYAFEKLRKEKAEVERALAEKAKRERDAEELAVASGYKSADDMFAAFRESKLKQEAESRGVDYDFYKQLKDTEGRVERLEREKQEQQVKFGVDRFMGTLDNLGDKYGLTHEERIGVLDAIGQKGFTKEQIASFNAPEEFIKGFIVDKIVASETQARLEAEKAAKKFEESKFGERAEKSTKSIDDIVAEEMKEWAKANGIKF